MSWLAHRITIIALALATFGAWAIDTEELPAPAKHEINFEKEIWPVFQKHCVKCHGPKKQKSDYRIDVKELAIEGGEMGQNIIAGKSSESPLVHFMSGLDEETVMPPKGELAGDKVLGLIRAWIDQGAEWPDNLGAKIADPMDHWAFKPITRPKPPKSGQPVDAFIVHQLAEKKLTLSPPASRETLIRRLYLVMHGLPPSPEEVKAFVNDTSPNAFNKLVEKVLASPRYGERWAAHWLDLVRFGETHGFETNRERLNAWPYRDWVIDSLNTDKPYDQFVREQLAGDALGAPVGTSFLVAGPNDLVKGQDPKHRVMQRMNELDDMINTTGTAFLGISTGCGRCHEHKFDPMTQTDYYALQAIFAGVNHADRTLPFNAKQKAKITALEKQISDLREKLAKYIPQSDAKKLPPVNYTHNIEKFPEIEAKFVRFTITQCSRSQPCIDELEIFSGTKNLALASKGAKASSNGDFKHPLHKLAHINDGKYGNPRSWIAAGKTGWVQIELPKPARINRIEWARDREGKISDRLPIGYRIEAALKMGEWRQIANSEERKPFNGGKSKAPSYTFKGLSKEETLHGQSLLSSLKGIEKQLANLKSSTKAYTGTFAQPGPTHRLYRGEPDAKREQVGPGAISAFVSLKLKRDTPEQQRRLALANWITDPKNPLTARVMANRIWQFHFGAGIVDTPSDLGHNGVPPSHPQLLDWLAAEFMANGWSIKHLHRTILLSRTWQQDGRPNKKAIAIDAASRLLWRFPTRRLEAEAMRDCMLAASGALDLKMGGPGFSGFEVQMENVRHFHPKKSFGPEDWRRMIYMTKVRQEKDAVFGAFDCPDASQVVPKRSRSTTPLQALNLLNSTFVVQQADLLAKRLEKDAGPDAGSQTRRAFDLCFGRAPDTTELKDATAFIQAEGLAQFARAMLNANEFVFIP